MKSSSLCAVLCAITATFTLSGCNSIGMEYPTFSETTNPLDYLIKYVEADENGLFSPYRAMSYLGLPGNIVVKDYSDHTLWKRTWCSKTDEPSFHDELIKVCEINGGTLQDDGWCVNPKNKAALFQVSTYLLHNHCTAGAGISTVGIFPKRGTTYTDPTWQQFVVTYKEAQKRESEEQRRAEEEKAKAERDAVQQRKLNTAKLLKARIGQTVCRYEPWHVGNYSIRQARLVQIIDDQRIVVEFAVPGHGGQRPQTKMSDSPNNWYICKAQRTTF